MSNIDWTKENRQAPIGLLLFFSNTLVKLVKTLWPLFLISLFNKSSDNKDVFYFWLSISATSFILINGSLSYWYSKFSIINNEFIVKKGYLKRVKLSIAIDRIQTVNIKQNILQKLLGVVSLEIDTAGANKTEIKFIAIKEELAAEFEKLFGRNSSKQPLKEEDAIQSNEITINEHSKTILHLGMSDLLKIGISENHLKSLLIVVGIIYSLYSQLQGGFEKKIEEFAESSIASIQNSSFSIYISIAISLLVVSILISFVITIIKFYDFKLVKSKASFSISYGLLNTKKINIPISKIQFISWHINPIRKLLNFENLTIKQASSGDNMQKAQRIEVAACNNMHKQRIEDIIFGEKEQLFKTQFKTHPLYFIRTFLILSTLLLIGTSYFIFFDIRFIIPIALVISLLAILLFMAWKKRYFSINNTNLNISKGQIGQVIYNINNFKIQSIEFKQSIFIKRRKLASIIIYTAAGSNLRIPYIDEYLARDLYDYLLYSIESSDNAWM